MRNDKRWRILLGPQYWMRHTYPRDDEDDLRLLGSVVRGQQVGALGVLANGSFVQVNGDYQVRLSTGQIQRALTIARGPSGQTSRPPDPPARPVQVMVKRRRVVALGDPTTPRAAGGDPLAVGAISRARVRKSVLLR
jgi:hypothetical protein